MPRSNAARDTSEAGDAFIGASAAYHVRCVALRPAPQQATRYAALFATRAGTQASFVEAEEFASFDPKVAG